MDGGVNRTEIDGVPVHWAPCPGPAVGVLLFRVGVCDEHLLRRGVTHLIEHLALSRFDARVTQFNGSVGPSITSFSIRGEIDEVCEHLTLVQRELANLPLDRSAHEARILRSEAALRGPSAAGRSFMIRYGAQGVGLLDFEELFLDVHDSSVISQHARRYFNRSNAAAVLSCPPTDSLRFDALPDGRHELIPPVVPQSIAFPAWDWMPSQMVVLSTMLQRSVAGPAATWILSNRLRETLRERHGLSYETGSSYEPWTAYEAHHLMWANARPDDAATVVAELQTELSRVVIEGVADEEVELYRQIVERGRSEPYSGFGECEFRATSELLGAGVPDVDQNWDDVSALVPGDIEVVADHVRSTALWLVPQHVEARDQRFHVVPQWSAADSPAGGRRHSAVAEGVDAAIAIDGNGITLVLGEGQKVYVSWYGLGACKRWADGGRTLIGNDGFVVTVRPDLWQEGDELVASIDRFTDPARVVVSSDAMPS